MSLTMSSALTANGQGPRPTWEIATLFPDQGDWTEADYFRLDAMRELQPLIELVEGTLEVLPRPTQVHQLLLQFLFKLLDQFVLTNDLGRVLVSGMWVRLHDGSNPRYRMPDVMFMTKANLERCHNDFWEGADLAMEIVSGSPQDRERDWKIKAQEYPKAGIGEYWIVDPERKLVRVLRLQGMSYQLHGEFHAGEQATSVLLPGFQVDVQALWAAGLMQG